MLELLFFFGCLKNIIYISYMKLIKIFLFVLLTTFAYSQNCPYLGPDQFLPCGVNSTTLTADFSQCAPGSNPNQTTNYGVTNIPYTPQNNTGTQLFMSDDSQQGPFNIGFIFCFFGQTYNQFWVGSNGWISFSAGQPITFTSTTIPSGVATVPRNCIMGPWQDWHPGVGGQIRYQVQGTAPCRKLIVSWINMPMFSCTNLQGTFHIVIHESTNVIENYIQNKPNCLAWAGGTAVQGLHNVAGTVGIAIPGRNSTQWTANNDAWRYTPSGPTVLPIPTWYQVGNPVPIGQGTTITVTPPTAGANYTCQLVYPTCNAGWNSCNSISGPGPDTVFVQPGPPNLPNPTINFTNPICSDSCNGTIDIIPVGTNGVANITWLTQPPLFNLTNLCAGIYDFTITDALGCTVLGNVTLTDPPIPIIGPLTGPDTICYLLNSEIYDVPDIAGYTYNWASLGNITSGQGTNSIIVDWSSIPSGNIVNAVSVSATNQNGCPTTDTLTINSFIFKIQPTITQIGPFCSNDECVDLTGIPLNGIFTGPGINGNQFCPTLADTLNNTITYTYIQSGCLFDTTSNIIVYERPVIDSIIPYENRVEICEGETTLTTYSAYSTLLGTFEWTFLNQTTETYNYTIVWEETGFYTLSVTQNLNGCVSEPFETTTIVDRCPETIYYLPNSFTPDGNEYNQVWQPIFTSGFDPYDFHITIFNRWGEMIWESYDHTKGWDGTYNGAACQEGIYNWILNFGDDRTDARYVDSGHVTILK
jgi:gliding motility-associated-like protein